MSNFYKIFLVTITPYVFASSSSSLDAGIQTYQDYESDKCTASSFRFAIHRDV